MVLFRSATGRNAFRSVPGWPPGKDRAASFSLTLRRGEGLVSKGNTGYLPAARDDRLQRTVAASPADQGPCRF